VVSHRTKSTKLKPHVHLRNYFKLEEKPNNLPSTRLSFLARATICIPCKWIRALPPPPCKTYPGGGSSGGGGGGGGGDGGDLRRARVLADL
jgi:hypothetical protein